MLAANCLALATQDGCDIAAARDTLQELVGDQRLGPDGTERCRETLRSLEPVELAAPLPGELPAPETLFQSWEGFRDAALIAACRAVFGDLIEALAGIGNTTRGALVGVLYGCIQELNRLDRDNDGFIETSDPARESCTCALAQLTGRHALNRMADGLRLHQQHVQ